MATRKRKAPSAPATTLDELRRLAEEGDSDEARLVYADALMAAGDARGELIAIEVELEKVPPLHPRRIELKEREALLFGEHRAAWREALGVDRALATCHVAYRRGFIDRVSLDDVRWRSIKRLVAALGANARAATCLAVSNKIDWPALVMLLEALPRVATLELGSTSVHAWAGEPSALFDHPVAERLTSLSYRLRSAEYDGVREALTRTARLGALRSLSLDARADVLVAVSEMASSPQITSWTLRGGDLDVEALVRILSAGGRRGADQPVRDLAVWGFELDEQTLVELARAVPARYRSVELTAPVPLEALTTFLRSDAARAIETLTITRRDPRETIAPLIAPVETSLESLSIGFVSPHDIEQLATSLRAPGLRTLHLNQDGSSPDGFARLFDSPWLDTVESLRLNGRDAEPWLGRVRRTESALTSLWFSGLGAEAARELVAWRGLSRVRALSNRHGSRFDGETVRRLLASAALSSLEILHLSLDTDAMLALDGAEALPRLAWLSIDVSDELSDAHVAALARWRGARTLRLLDLRGYHRRLTENWVDLLVDRGLFPQLTLVHRPGVARPEANARLRERFGGGIEFDPPPHPDLPFA